MDLVDYARYRWKPLLALFLAGLVAIGVLGAQAGGSGYQASTTLLVRPPASALSAYASDLDRFVETEMTLLTTTESLEAAVEGTGIPASDLFGALTFDHPPGSERVTLSVVNDNPEEAVTLVNAVADYYLESSEDRFAAPARREEQMLTDRITDFQEQLADTNAVIARATNDFTAQNPDLGIPTASQVAPVAYANQVLLTSRLQQAYQQQAEAQLTASTSGSRSSVLTAATGATPPAAWGATTYLAAVVGLLLLLVALTATGLALSSRVLSPGRWTTAVGEQTLHRPLRTRRLTARQRRDTVRQVALAVKAAGGDARVVALHFPDTTSASRRKSAFLLKGLSDQGIQVEDVDSVDDLAPAETGKSSSGRVRNVKALLLVDAQACRTEEASLLADIPESARRSSIPVLL